MKSNRPFLFGTSFALMAAVLPAVAFAAIVPPVSIPIASFGPLCAYTGLCWMSPTTGILSIQAYLSGIIVPAVKVIFVGVAVLYVARFAITIIMFGGNESTLTEQRQAFGEAARGMALVGIATLIVDTFAPSAAGTGLVNQTPLTDAFNRIADYITIITGAFLIFIISFAGFRIIVLQGNEGEVDKQKKNFFNGLLGVVLLLTARIIVDAILPSGSPNGLVVEIGGMIRFLLEIIAGLAIVSIIASGLLFIVSLHNDNVRQRAKRILLSTIIILIIVIFSHLIVSTFMPAFLAPTTVS